MSVSGVSGAATAASATASYMSSPAVQFAQIQSATLSTLFAPTTGEPSDLISLTSSAVALPLYQQPGLLSGLTQWDGSMTPGSQRTAAAASDPTAGSAAGATATPSASSTPIFSFNPFDQASWWTDPKGSTVDTSA